MNTFEEKIIKSITHREKCYIVGDYSTYPNKYISRIKQVKDYGQMYFVSAYDVYIKDDKLDEEKLWRHVLAIDIEVEYY